MPKNKNIEATLISFAIILDSKGRLFTETVDISNNDLKKLFKDEDWEHVVLPLNGSINAARAGIKDILRRIKDELGAV